MADIATATVTSTGQIVVRLNPALVPFRYTEVDIEGVALVHSDLHFNMKAHEPSPEGTSALIRTRALVLSERQIAIVMSTLRRRHAKHPDEKFQEKMVVGGSLMDLYHAAVEGGMTTLRQDGMQKVKAGITTVEEVFRVTAA